jgi:hypothetical protein
VSPRDAVPYFEIRKSKIQGRGAFATRRIRAGARVIEYTGELISQDEANRRYEDDSMGRHHTFLFAVEGDRVIDGAAGGNESRFINHSCAPNCQAVSEGQRVFIEALTTIEPGTELVYDYAYARTPENDNPESEALYACRCGAPTCRGTILEPPRRTASRAAAKTGAGKQGGAKKAASKTGAAKRAAKTGATRTRAAKTGATKAGTAKPSRAKPSRAKTGGAKRGAASKGGATAKGGAATKASTRSAPKSPATRAPADGASARRAAPTKAGAAKRGAAERGARRG